MKDSRVFNMELLHMGPLYVYGGGKFKVSEIAQRLTRCSRQTRKAVG